MSESSVPFSVKNEALKLVESQAKELALFDKSLRAMNEEISVLVDLLREVLTLDVLEADMVDEIDSVLAQYAQGES